MLHFNFYPSYFSISICFMIMPTINSPYSFNLVLHSVPVLVEGNKIPFALVENLNSALRAINDSKGKDYEIMCVRLTIITSLNLTT